MVLKRLIQWVVAGMFLVVAAACTPEYEEEVETPAGEQEVEVEEGITGEEEVEIEEEPES